MPVNRKIIPDTCFRLISKIFAANGGRYAWSIARACVSGSLASRKKKDATDLYIYICAVSIFRLNVKLKGTMFSSKLK